MEKSPMERKEEAPVRNILTHPKETIEAIATLEGPRWLAAQERMRKRLEEDGITDSAEIERVAYNTLPGLVEWLREQQERERDPERSRWRYVLYGNGGFNRWYVDEDGTVAFSESHAQTGHAQRARDLGFAINS